MKYKILKYAKDDKEVWDCYLCEDENGVRKWIDIFVDRSHKGFDEKADREMYVGKIIEIESTFSYTPLYIGEGVTLLEEK